jgi:hypothetical protein
MGRHKRGKAYLRKLQDFKLRRFLREGADNIQKTSHAQTMFGFQQRTNMETNKGHDWLRAIVISNYEAMWLAHGSQVIDHMTRNRGKEETHLAGGILYVQAHSKG